MDAVGVFDDLIDIVGEGVARLVERIHLERAAAFACNAVVVPPRELGYEDGLVAAFHEVVVDGVLQHLLATVAQQYLFFGHMIYFAEADADFALLPLVVDAGVEAERVGIEVLYGFDDFLRRLEVEFVSVEKIHVLS